MTIQNYAIPVISGLLTILSTLYIIAIIALYTIKRGKSGLYDAALYLVAIAEEEWGGKTGQIKFAEVITTLRQMHPLVTLFITEQTLSNIVERALSEFKIILAEKKALEESGKVTFRQ